MGASEDWGAASGSDVARCCWAVSVAEAFTRRWLALLEQPSKPCSDKIMVDHLASLAAGCFVAAVCSVLVNTYNTHLCCDPGGVEQGSQWLCIRLTQECGAHMQLCNSIRIAM